MRFPRRNAKVPAPDPNRPFPRRVAFRARSVRAKVPPGLDRGAVSYDGRGL